MAWTQAFPSAAAVEEQRRAALRWPVGAVSPLWAVFGAAASAGVAWWWMTRWTRAVNVEALADFAAAEATQSSPRRSADAELRVEEAVVEADVEVDAAEPPAPPEPALEAEAAPA